eukprot:353050-Hanusia_phi.AAC.1
MSSSPSSHTTGAHLPCFVSEQSSQVAWKLPGLSQLDTLAFESAPTTRYPSWQTAVTLTLWLSFVSDDAAGSKYGPLAQKPCSPYA